MSDNIVGKLNTSYLYRIDPHTVEGWFNGKRLVFHIKSVLIDGEYYDTLYTRKNGNDDEFHAFLVPRGGFIKGDIIPWNGVQITGRTNHYTSRKVIRKLEIIDSNFLNPRNHI